VKGKAYRLWGETKSMKNLRDIIAEKFLRDKIDEKSVWDIIVVKEHG
jgi:hypothetical protein